jgi:hypothetical protein
MWPNRAWRWSAMISGRFINPVDSWMEMFVAWSNHLMLRILRCDIMWKIEVYRCMTCRESRPPNHTTRRREWMMCIDGVLSANWVSVASI